MRIFQVLSLAFVLVAVSGSLAQRASAEGPPDSCRDAPVPFAHCANASLNFESVMLVVHGWNGSCTSTFGEGDQSIYRVLAGKQFYDYDCFLYDSTGTALSENLTRLRGQIDQLARKGYRRVLFVTHSTGGVMVLKLLVESLFDGDNPKSPPGDADFLGVKGLRVSGVQAWAAPMEGLRAHITLGHAVLRFFGYGPETVPDLEPGSDYLATLKKRLTRLSQLRADNANRWLWSATDFPVNFFHGQSDDYVVLPLHQNGQWFWPRRWRVVSSGMGHMHNISKNGDHAYIKEPTFPAHVMNREALLGLEFRPRINYLWPRNLPVTPDSLIARQKIVINAFEYYVAERFDESLPQVLDFLAHILENDCTRASQVDRAAVKALLKLVANKFEFPTETTARFFTQVVRQAFSKFDPAGGSDVCRFGHNLGDVSKDILELLRSIHKSVMVYLESNPALAERILPETLKTPEAFDVYMVGLIQRFLDSGSDEVQDAALQAIVPMVQYASATAIKSSGLMEKLGSFTESQRYTLSAARKGLVSAGFAAFVGKGGEIRTAALTRLSEITRYLKREEPLWRVLATDKNVTKVVTAIDPKTVTTRAEFDFLAQVAAKAGASGNNKDIAAIASAKTIAAFHNLDRDTAEAWMKEVVEKPVNYEFVKSAFKKAISK